MLTQKFIDNIKQSRESHHDTIYCTKEQERGLKRESTAGGILANNVDNLQFRGLDVQSLPQLSAAIICQKGEVFPLAKDYKNNDR